MRLSAPLLLLAAVFVLGCSEAQDDVIVEPTKTPRSTKTSNEKPAAPAEPKVTLELVDIEGIHAAVAQYKGKVVVMDAWATWCGPCLEEFPNLIAIHKKYGPDKVACISLSFDDVPDQKNVLKFLKEQKADFKNLQTKVDPDKLFDHFKIPALPAVLVYGKDGKLVKLADGHEAYKAVNPLVEELVTGKEPAKKAE